MRINELDDFETRDKLRKFGFDLGMTLDEIQEFCVGPIILGVQGIFEGAPLYYAAQQGDAKLVEVLCKNGANPNKSIEHENGSTSNDGDTPLLIAVRYGRAEAVKILLEYGADPAYVNKYSHKSVKYNLDEGRHASSGIFGFFSTQIDKRLIGKDINYDKTEQYLKEFKQRTRPPITNLG